MTVVDMAWVERLAELADAKVEVDRDGGVVVSPRRRIGTSGPPPAWPCSSPANSTLRGLVYVAVP